MMGYEIQKGSSKFLYGMSNPDQLREWLVENGDSIGVSFVGRSNVGKSSLINSVFGNGTARTSKTPGRTREINIFSFNLSHDGEIADELPTLYLFDLPGYGHAQVSKEMSKNWVDLMETFFEGVTNHVSMVNLQDARHPEQKADIEFQSFLRSYDFETTLVFNKIDKLKKQSERAKLNNMKPRIFEAYNWVKKILFVSAEKRTGLKELEDSLTMFILDKLQD